MMTIKLLGKEQSNGGAGKRIFKREVDITGTDTAASK